MDIINIKLPVNKANELKKFLENHPEDSDIINITHLISYQIDNYYFYSDLKKEHESHLVRK